MSGYGYGCACVYNTSLGWVTGKRGGSLSLAGHQLSSRFNKNLSQNNKAEGDRVVHLMSFSELHVHSEIQYPLTYVHTTEGGGRREGGRAGEGEGGGVSSLIKGLMYRGIR